MSWDDRIFTGQHGDYSWLVTTLPIRRTVDLALRFHPEQALWLATLHCSAPTLSSRDAAEGWVQAGGGLLHRNPSELANIPSSHDDEYYFIPGDETPLAPPPNRFVTYTTFNLESPSTLESTFDPTWETGVLDWLRPLQAAFWDHLNQLGAISYVGDGDRVIVATRRKDFFAAVLQLVNDLA
ncbi:MAG: hypothetical protein VX899_22945 [Myxococcota bacterium]|nr:hypothetical protein [Myxococcota bacterium]